MQQWTRQTHNMATKKTTKTTKQDFAKAFSELEQITEWFEGDDVDLEEGLKQFEKGMKLAKMCKERLAQVENAIEEIKETFTDNNEA